jgi:hypothetical protein
MITFETQEDFENAVMAVMVEKLCMQVYTRGSPFLTNVEVKIGNSDDFRYFLESSGGCN